MRRRAATGRWILSASPNGNGKSHPHPPDEHLAQYARHLRISPLCAALLLRRGHQSVESAEEFLSRALTLLHDPAALPDIAPAVSRIAEAVEKDQRILIFGDYDADGITATALLERFFRTLKRHSTGGDARSTITTGRDARSTSAGGDARSTGRGFSVEARVPERTDGYGLSAAAAARILESPPDLLITLDNGINAHEPLARLAQAGIDCIVVDHHMPGASLPRALAVVNPKRHGHAYPFAELCGAGLAFKLAWALAVHYSQNRRVTQDFKAFLLDSLALAAVGTLADVVPLTGENRVLAHHGLDALRKTRLPGLRALMEVSRLKHGALPRAHDVAFRLAPRLNAAGRVAQASEALELLLTDDAARATELAAALDGYNSLRRKMERQILEGARGQALAHLERQPGAHAFVLDSPDWHAGILGIVASRVVEEFHRPVVMLSVSGEGASATARGSARSIHGLDLHRALSLQSELLLAFGGHAAAAGLSMQAARIAEFRESFERTAASLLHPDDLLPRLHIDACVTLERVNGRLVAELDMFEPCGAGNPRPMLAACGVHVPGRPRLLGRDENHLEFYARQNDATRRVVSFNGADSFNALCDCQKGGQVDLAFNPSIDDFQGAQSVELHLEAFRPSASGA